MHLNLQTKANLKARGQRQEARGLTSDLRLPSSDFRPLTSGFTLVELMVAVGVAMLVLTAMAMVFVTSARSFATMGNYVSMNSSSRNALDRLTREIRRSGDLTDFFSTPTEARLQFRSFGATNSYVLYQWDADSRQLTERRTGSTETNVLLTGCDELTFAMYKNSFTPTTDVTAGKAISVSWNCSRTILGKKTTTEPIQQALIVIRNKQ